MCEFTTALNIAILERVDKRANFDVVAIRDAVRAMEPSKDIRYLPVKYELLAAFERTGGFGGIYKLSTKQVDGKNVFSFEPNTVTATGRLSSSDNSDTTVLARHMVVLFMLLFMLILGCWIILFFCYL